MVRIINNTPNKESVITLDELLVTNLNNKILVSVYNNHATVAMTEEYYSSGLLTFCVDLGEGPSNCHTRTKGNKKDLVLRMRDEGLLSEEAQFYVFDTQKEFFQAAVDNGWH